jgi:hypothetical protein
MAEFTSQTHGLTWLIYLSEPGREMRGPGRRNMRKVPLKFTYVETEPNPVICTFNYTILMAPGCTGTFI